jgi:hypothetical protein
MPHVRSPAHRVLAAQHGPGFVGDVAAELVAELAEATSAILTEEDCADLRPDLRASSYVP